ncbi:MAG: multiheme c-type cytochrome [Planctomycetota bacterium]|nr:multiheme c-type cytochrome [Planctomycetota bacterium]
MDSSPASSNSKLWLAVIALPILLIIGPRTSISQDLNPEKATKEFAVVGPEKCAECHEFELKTLQRSAHQRSFKLHGKDAATKIAKRLGGEARVDKRKDCAACHYTKKARKDAAPELLAGVSCESCHGPAKLWWNLHWKGEGQSLAKNMAKSEKRGMIRPSKVIALIDRCLDCHLVADEALISKGGHPLTEGFELISWLQGEVRHNFLNSEDYGANMPISKSRRRQFFVLGRLRQLERQLRVFASLKDRKGALAKSLGRDILRAYKDLKKARGSVKRLEKIRELLAGIRLNESTPAKIKEASDGIAKIIEGLAKDRKALDVEDLDALLPKEFRGKVSEFRDSE